jgi:hypothetical protein
MLTVHDHEYAPKAFSQGQDTHSPYNSQQSC